MNERGATLLLGVLIMGAVMVSIATTIILIGIGNTQTAVVDNQEAQAKSINKACAEYVLQQIHDSSSFIGTGTHSVAGQNCNYEVINLGGEGRQIQLQTIVGQSNRREKIVLNQLTPDINVSSWLEVTAF